MIYKILAVISTTLFYVFMLWMSKKMDGTSAIVVIVLATIIVLVVLLSLITL